MKIMSEEIISNTEITKEYKACREKAKKLGKTFIFKNNVPDMVLMDVDEYNSVFARIYDILDEIEHAEIYDMVTERRKKDTGKRYTLDDLKNKINKNKSTI